LIVSRKRLGNYDSRSLELTFGKAAAKDRRLALRPGKG
jgi:hypothetical protein